MSENKISIGDVVVTSVTDGIEEVPASTVFPKVPIASWSEYPGMLSPEGKLKTNFGSFVIRSQNQTILVDTGWGPEYPGSLLDELKDRGVSLEEITQVAITHLHIDHVGWNISRDNDQRHLTFPNARYWIPKDDLDYYQQPDRLRVSPHIPDQVLLLEQFDALELVEGETSLTSEVTMVPTPGHTPGHMSIAISSQGQRGFILGDVINYPVQAEETTWELIYDEDHERARQTREIVLERLEVDGALVGMGHYPLPSFGRFVRREGRRYWQVL